MPTCQHCYRDFPNWVEIKGRRRNVSNRKFCIDCSPFGQHNTSPSLTSGKLHCSRCQQTKTDDCFYRRKSGSLRTKYCIECLSFQYAERHENNKLKCVEYLGGSCVVCGYHRCLAALEFHHKDPTKKEFTISAVRKFDFDKIKTELDKCDLLCCRCHREVHSKNPVRESNPPA